MAVSTTCKSCRHFTLDRVLYGRHASEGLGHCAFDAARGKSCFRPIDYTCNRYDATDRRKAYLASLAERPAMAA